MTLLEQVGYNDVDIHVWQQSLHLVHVTAVSVLAHHVKQKSCLI